MIRDKQRLSELMTLFDWFNRTTPEHQIEFIETLSKQQIKYLESTDLFNVNGRIGNLNHDNFTPSHNLVSTRFIEAEFDLKDEFEINDKLIPCNSQVKLLDLLKTILEDTEETDLLFEKIRFYNEEYMTQSCPFDKDEFGGDFDGDTISNYDKMQMKGRINRNPCLDVAEIKKQKRSAQKTMRIAETNFNKIKQQMMQEGQI